jgi:hypothetical protein
MTAPVYEAIVKEARMEATRLAAAAGSLQLLDADDVPLVTFPLSATAGSVGEVGGAMRWTMTFGVGSTGNDAQVATGAGNAAKAIIRDSTDATIISGLTVGTEAAGVIIDNVSIAVGQTVNLSSAYINHAADPV